MTRALVIAALLLAGGCKKRDADLPARAKAALGPSAVCTWVGRHDYASRCHRDGVRFDCIEDESTAKVSCLVVSEATPER